MREIKTEIVIKSTPEKVWNVLCDVDSYKNWSPTIFAATGKVALGEKLAITMCGHDGKQSHQYHPVVCEFNPQKKMRWQAKLGAKFILANDKLIELMPFDQGVKLTHSEIFEGFLPSLMWGNMKKQVPIMLNAFNEALKKHIES